MVAPERQLENLMRSLRFAVWTATILFVLTLLLQLPRWVLRFIPPYTILAHEAVEGKVKAGDELQVRYHVIRRRICRTDIDRVVRRDDGTVIHRDRMPGGIVMVGEFKGVLTSVRIPPNTPPGSYTYQVVILNECADGFYVLAVPPTPFEVIT